MDDPRVAELKTEIVVLASTIASSREKAEKLLKQAAELKESARDRAAVRAAQLRKQIAQAREETRVVLEAIGETKLATEHELAHEEAKRAAIVEEAEKHVKALETELEDIMVHSKDTAEHMEMMRDELDRLNGMLANE